MAVGVVDPDPMTAMEAELRTEKIRFEDSPYQTDEGEPQSQFKVLLRVLQGAGERNNETFIDYFTFPKTGKMSPKSKAGQYVAASLPDNSIAETLEELVERLPGTTFVAAIGTNKAGTLSKVTHDTIRPSRRKPPEPPEDDSPDDDWNDIPF